jgi:hypothetical protein
MGEHKKRGDFGISHLREDPALANKPFEASALAARLETKRIR